MSAVKLEDRVAALEADDARIKAKMDAADKANPWNEDVYGAFANDPVFLEAMRLGLEYRDSQRPKPRKAP
jgi:hypothetical protein